MTRDLVSLGLDFVGSLAAVYVWFHFDLDGKLEHRKHARMIQRGEKFDKRRRDL